MSRHVGRLAAAALLGALLGSAFAAVFYAWQAGVRTDFVTDPPSLISGVYPAEHDPNWTLTFAWTRDEVKIRLPGIDRRIPWTFAARVRGGRPDVNPSIEILCDGLPIATFQTGAEFDEVRATLPAHPERPHGATLTLHVSSTFVPGPSDPRPLGVMLDWLSLTPSGTALAPRSALLGSAVASAAAGVALASIGLTAGSAILGAAVVSAGIAAVVTRGFAPYSGFPNTAILVSLWTGAALVCGVAIVRMARRRPLRNTARFAAVFTSMALLLKLLVLLHPDMPIGDAMFHAHRFQTVLGGTLLFTSVAPGGYQFPYPPGLYVLSAVFASLVHRGAADVSLLRIVVAAADAAAALVLYRVVVHGWGDRLAAAMAVALYHLTPIDFTVMTTANLTNAFAQSVGVVALALMASAVVTLSNVIALTALTAALAVAFLSHTSTLAILFAVAVFCALFFLARGGPALRSGAFAIAVAAIVAAVLSVVVYYGHFLATYRAEFARIGQETAAGTAAGHRSIAQRAGEVPYGLRINFGLALLALAALGGWWQYARAAADRLSLTVAGWLVACAAFLLVGVLTPVDLRYYLAAIPAVAVLAARGAARAWEQRGMWRVAVAVALAWIVIAGIGTWWNALA